MPHACALIAGAAAAAAGIGSDHVDLEAAAEKGLTVAECTGAHTCALNPEALNPQPQPLIHEHVDSEPAGSPAHSWQHMNRLASGCGWSHPTCDYTELQTHPHSFIYTCAGSNTVSVAEDEVLRILLLMRNFLPAHEQSKNVQRWRGELWLAEGSMSSCC